MADVTITAAYPMEMGVQSTKSLAMAQFCTRSGGVIIWVAPQKQAGPIMPLIKEISSAETATEAHRRLSRGDVPDHLKSFGISYIMQVVVFKELAEKFGIIHVSEGLSDEQVKMMKMTPAHTMDEAIRMASSIVPQAEVAIFPSGGTVIPGVHSGRQAQKAEPIGK